MPTEPSDFDKIETALTEALTGADTRQLDTELREFRSVHNGRFRKLMEAQEFRALWRAMSSACETNDES